MRQGIDIKEVESATKIRGKYLRALENEEFELLPGSTFVRTFLRSYSEFLGLDSQLLVEEYRAQHEPRSESDMQHFARQPPRGRERRNARPPSRGLLALGLIGVLFAFIIVLGLTGGDDDAGGPTGADVTTPDERRQADARRRRPSPERTRRKPAATDVRLQIRPTEATYLCVDDGAGRVLFQGTLSEPRTFRQKRLRMNLGRTSAMVRVNGRPVPLGGGSDSVGFAFTPRGRQPLAEAERPCV
jgi:cytoskeletal protein RodZ